MKKIFTTVLGAWLCLTAMANDRAIVTTRATQVMYADSAQQAGLPQAYTGRGVLMGVIDSGFLYWHNAFLTADGTPRYECALSNDPRYQSFDTDSIMSWDPVGFHGTNTMCVAGGTPLMTTLKAGGTRLCTGVATETQLVPALHVTMNDTLGLPFSEFEEDYEYAELVDRVFAYADSLKMPCVINMSQGHIIGLHHKNNRFGQLISKHYNVPGHIIAMSSGNSGNSKSCFDYTFGSDADTLTINALFGKGEGTIVVWSSDTTMIDMEVRTNRGSVIDIDAPDSEIKMITGIDEYLNQRWMMIYPVTSYLAAFNYLFTGHEGMRLLGYSHEDKVDLKASLSNGQSADGIISDKYSINDRACNPYVISVGVAGWSGSCWGYDMEGNRYPDICAPGELYFAINGQHSFVFGGLGTMPSVAREGNDCWFGYSKGTSYSSPHVAGIIALMLEANPRLTTDEVRTILRATRQDIPLDEMEMEIPSLAVQQEIGMVNALEAVRAVLTATGIDTLPTAETKSGKCLQDGRLMIVRGGQRYDIFGRKTF